MNNNNKKKKKEHSLIVQSFQYDNINPVSTSGVEFSPVPAAATIPANDTLTIRLMGTPLETGALTIRGCIIKITGFAEQEFLNEKQKTEQIKEKENKVMSLVESKRHKYRYVHSLKRDGI